MRSTRELRRAALKHPRKPPMATLMTLLRAGFTKPLPSPRALVVSYTTVSPLPRIGVAVCFLWHCPAGHPGLLLATTLPYGVRTFLDNTTAANCTTPIVAAITQPTHPRPLCYGTRVLGILALNVDRAANSRWYTSRNTQSPPKVWWLDRNGGPIRVHARVVRVAKPQ